MSTTPGNGIPGAQPGPLPPPAFPSPGVPPSSGQGPPFGAPPAPPAGPPPYMPPSSGGGGNGKTIGIVIAAVVAVVALIGGVVAFTGGDDDEQASDTTEETTERTDEPTDTTDGPPDTTAEPPDTTDEPTDTTDEATTTTAVANTTAAPTTPAPATTAAPPPVGGAVPFTRLSEVLLPADPAALRATLATFGFPEWWPIPDVMSTEPLPVLQGMNARDSVSDPGTTSAFGSISRTTSYLDPNPDINAAEATWTAKLPADLFDVAAAVVEKTAQTQEGRTFYSYNALALDGSFDSVSLQLQEALSDTGEKVGVFVDINYFPSVEQPSPVPTGAGTGKQFLGSAPTAPQMIWSSTGLRLSGGSGLIATNPYGSYEATWKVAAADKDAVIAFLSDPANFSGDLAPTAAGAFTSDSFWEQSMDYQGFAGEYGLYHDPTSTDDIYLTLTFDLLDE